MNKIWFKRKLYGWGWTPVTWEGWVMIGGPPPPVITPFIMNAIAGMQPEAKIKATQLATLMEAAKDGVPFCENCALAIVKGED